MVLKSTHLDKIAKEVEVEERSKKWDPGTQGGEEEHRKKMGRGIQGGGSKTKRRQSQGGKSDLLSNWSLALILNATNGSNKMRVEIDMEVSDFDTFRMSKVPSMKVWFKWIEN